MSEPKYEVVWPLGKAIFQVVSPRARISDLSGKTVCELWDWLFRGDEIFQAVRDLLSERYPGIKFVDYNVFGNIRGPKETEAISAIPELLRRNGCDVVIAGVGA